MRKLKICFDAGHGGHDPGAIGTYFSGWEDGLAIVQEKDLTLAIAKYCSRYIQEKDYPIIPFMTRTSDTYVSLSERCLVANNGGANLFVSIHHNAREMQGRFGFEIETYHHESSIIGKVLVEVIQEHYIFEFPTGINMPVIDRGVKTANFYVLKHTSMPAVLVELGFLRDREEVRFLHMAGTVKVLARLLIEGLMIFYRTEVV